jgi:hypothetical protein
MFKARSSLPFYSIYAEDSKYSGVIPHSRLRTKEGDRTHRILSRSWGLPFHLNYLYLIIIGGQFNRKTFSPGIVSAITISGTNA